MEDTRTELALELSARSSRLAAARSSWDVLWQDIANYVMPRKAEIIQKQGSPNVSKQTRLFDGTAIRANQILANGQLAWMTPMESRWFSYDAPAHLKGNDKAEQWYRTCTEVAILELAKSNFYTEIHELYLDRGAFGTAALHLEEGKKSPLNFTTLTCGTYSIAENDEGYVDTIYRSVPMTLRNVVGKFGIENVSPELQSKYKDAKGKNLDTEIKITHAIYPRADQDCDHTKRDGKNKPIASVYFEEATKHILRESGYDDMPTFATRYLKWGNSAYGWSPSWIALPDARQLNFLERQMDALAELQAFPRMLIPDSMEGTVDFRANGATYYDATNPTAIPKEWATGGRYDVGVARSETKRKSIEDAFHVDLFQMFAQIQKQMTATEVSERAAEKLIQFSPTFARMTTELFGPILKRTFTLLITAGYFPPPPQEVLQQDHAGISIAEPQISYSSRIALAIKALENVSFTRFLSTFLPISQIQPDVLDNIDFDQASRDFARNEGMPARWIRDMDLVNQNREARAQAMQQQEQIAQAQQAAEALAKAGSIKNDSMIAQQLGTTPGMPTV